MVSEQMLNDIQDWSLEQLRKWYEDAVMHYRVADASQTEAEIRVLETLMKISAGMIANNTTATSADAGAMFARLVRDIRRHLEQTKAYH